jgi:hypothetical protein
MASYTGADGSRLPCAKYTKVAASQTTAQISASGNANERGDYLAGVLVTWASTLTGTVNVLDGTTSLALIPSPVTGATDITPRYVEYGVVAQSTMGFDITTGSSVSCIAIGRFSQASRTNRGPAPSGAFFIAVGRRAEWMQ